MKKQLPSAKLPLPGFRAEKADTGYFAAHSLADVWDQLPAAKSAKPSAALEKSIRERHSPANSPISIRLVPDRIEAAKKIAATKSVAVR